MGFLYVLCASTGALRDGFPVQMNEIQAQVAAADVDADGSLELIAVDAAGSVAAWRHDGSRLWEVQISGLCAQSVTVSDLRGDGSVQVIVPSASGFLHVLDGRDGRERSPFPLKTGGELMASALVVNLQGPPSVPMPGLAEPPPTPHIVVPSFDGFLYVVNGRTGCTQKVDVGEHAYAQVLADDLTGNGKMDLLLGTMNGNLYCFETNTVYHPMRSWRSQVQGRNVFEQREGHLGIELRRRQLRGGGRYVSGASFEIEFEIYDERHLPNATYNVTVRLGQMPPMMTRSYDSPGRKLEVVDCPNRTLEAVLVLSMVNEHAQYFEDTVHVQMNTEFEEIFKWTTALPLFLLTLVLTASSLSRGTEQLPV
mmetsp:Transcript_10915/g.23292  ORF Transcript_10915/g.23292 Transcript_10915/m.23292 type:complete len:367 (+) Transcript_10915:3-1103(+)